MSTLQSIIDALETQLATILTTGGYGTNAGQHVYETRSTPLNDTEMPGIVFTYEEEVGADTFAEELHTLEIEFELHAAGASARNTVRAVAKDVVTAMAVDTTLSGLADDVELPRESGLKVEAADQDYALGRLGMAVQYTTDLYGS